jgi:hypothetical protein
MHTLKNLQGEWGSPHYTLGAMLGEVHEVLLQQYGSLKGEQPYRQSAEERAIQHFCACTDEEAIDFLLFCFHAHSLGTWADSQESQVAITGINEIFEEHGIGYEFTKTVIVETNEPATLYGRKTGGTSFRTEYPRVIVKSECATHQNTVKPAIEALRDARFASANNELLDAFDEVRKGDYADAITSCGSAFESVLKTICNAKKWKYDPNKDTCAKLVEICRDNNLFPPFYTEAFKAVGTIRNKIGDAHGKGPAPTHKAEREHAEHMIATTCAHITFLIKQAGL